MRKNLLRLLAVTVLLANACGGGQPGGSPSDCVDLTGSPTAEIRLLDNTFDPDCFTVSEDQGLSLPNDGVAVHNFSVEGSDVDLDVDPGEETNTEAIGEILRPGDHEVICKYHLPTMVAELKVV